MKIQPRTEQEIAENKLWKKGVYGFEVTDACEKTSEAGNEMIELTLRLSDGERTRLINDHLLDKTPEKTRHACAACGLLAQYESGELSAVDFIGKTGNVSLRIEKGRNGYRDKNMIADYLTDDALAAPVAIDVMAMLKKRAGAA